MFKYFSTVRRACSRRWLLLALITPLVANAVDFDSYEQANQFNEDVQKEVWLEAPVAIPDYPEDDDLTELPVQLNTAALTVLVDVDSVSAGEDGVVRYTLALRSRSGAENLFYEGMRCSTSEWKTYAYGSAQGKWRINETEWRPLVNMGSGEYRYSLYQGFLCEPSGRHLRTREIQQRLRYGRKTIDDINR